MYAEERQQHIVDRARREGRVDVADLSAELAVTGETIRRDLSVLERHGLLRRVHGGAIPVERLGFEPALAARDTLLTAEKDRIADEEIVAMAEGLDRVVVISSDREVREGSEDGGAVVLWSEALKDWLARA